MGLVREAHHIGHSIDSPPLNGLLFGRGRPDLLDLRVAGSNHEVAEHALFHRGDTGLHRPGRVAVAEGAGQAQLRDVEAVGEGDRLLRSLAQPGRCGSDAYYCEEHQ